MICFDLLPLLRTTVKTKTEELAVNVLRQKPESKHILLTLKPWVSEMEEDCGSCGIFLSTEYQIGQVRLGVTDLYIIVV